MGQCALSEEVAYTGAGSSWWTRGGILLCRTEVRDEGGAGERGVDG